MQTPIDRALDAQFVRRWNLVATTGPSNVASHSFNVAVIAMAIRNKMFNTIAINSAELCKFAILHDIDEVYTGDLPTPTKMAMREKGVEPNDLFIGQGIENSPNEVMKQIIKMADLIDNYTFIRQYGVGIRAEHAANEVGKRLNDALREAHTDLSRAARLVLEYIVERKSESDEERERIEADRKERNKINNSCPHIDVMD